MVKKVRNRWRFTALIPRPLPESSFNSVQDDPKLRRPRLHPAKLERTFTFTRVDRGTFTVEDHFEFTTPKPFETTHKL